MSATLPPPRRVIAFHTPSGGTTMQESEVPMKRFGEEGGISLGTAFVLDGGLTADPLEAARGKDVQVEGTVRKNGIIGRVVELAPGAESPMHYTESIDICTILHGTVDCIAQDGQVVQVHAGEVFVECSNLHQIKNSTSEPARLFTVAVPCKPTLIDGQELSEKFNAINLTHWC